MRPTRSRLLWLVVGVAAAMSAAATAADPPPPCAPGDRSYQRVLAPSELPWRYTTGAAVVPISDERESFHPLSLRTRIDALDGGRLRAAGSELPLGSGRLHPGAEVREVRFRPGDTGGRVTFSYEDPYETEERASCTRTLTADIRALPDEGVRVRGARTRQRGERLIVTGRLTRRARRPILLVVRGVTEGGDDIELGHKRVRTRGRRFRTWFSLRWYSRFDLPLRRLVVRGFHPGDFREPVPLVRP